MPRPMTANAIPTRRSGSPPVWASPVVEPDADDEVDGSVAAGVDEVAVPEPDGVCDSLGVSVGVGDTECWVAVADSEGVTDSTG